MEKTTNKTENKGGLKKVFRNLMSEFNRIVWPSRDSLVKRTIAVLASSVVLGGIIAVIDMIVKFGLGLVIA